MPIEKLNDTKNMKTVYFSYLFIYYMHVSKYLKHPITTYP